MKIKEIIQSFSSQLRTNKPVVIEIKPQPGSRYTLRLAQQITPETDILLNGAKYHVITGFHHGLTQVKLKEYNIEVGTVLHDFDLSTWDSVNPQYPTQKPRIFTEGDYAGFEMLHQGFPYYRHVVLVPGIGRRDLWVSDQMKGREIGLLEQKERTEAIIEPEAPKENSEMITKLEIPNLDFFNEFDKEI